MVTALNCKPTNTEEVIDYISCLSTSFSRHENIDSCLELDDDEVSLCLWASVDLNALDVASILLQQCWTPLSENAANQKHEIRISYMRSITCHLVNLTKDCHKIELLELAYSLLHSLLSYSNEGNYSISSLNHNLFTCIESCVLLIRVII